VEVAKVLQALVRQRQPPTVVTFHDEATNDTSDEKHEVSEFREEDNPSLADIIRLLSDIRDDIDNSVLSIDDVVPTVTIHDPDKRWYRTDGSLDDFRFYSTSSLFSSNSDSENSKSDNLICHRDEYINLVDEWNRQNAEMGETFV